MTFLKLSSSIINTRYIKFIDFSNKKYIIHTIDQVNDGCFFFGFGLFESSNSKAVVCPEKNPQDYIALQTWINSLGQHKPWSYHLDGKNTSTFVPQPKSQDAE
jgi:hypothetical protein